MNKERIIQVLLGLWYVVWVAVAITSFVAALTDQETTQNPSGNSGFYAALVALCVAVIALTQDARKFKSLKLGEAVLKLMVGIGLLAGSYLWLSSEAQAHPTDLEILYSLLFVVALAGVLLLLFVVPFTPFLITFFRNRNDSADNGDSGDSKDQP